MGGIEEEKPKIEESVYFCSHCGKEGKEPHKPHCRVAIEEAKKKKKNLISWEY